MIENERKFILTTIPPGFKKRFIIDQYYPIVTDNYEIRVRKQQRIRRLWPLNYILKGKSIYTFTLKTGGYKQKREEIENIITKDAFNNIVNFNTDLPHINKVLYVYNKNVCVAEFSNGLLLGEVENINAVPSYFKVQKEVTGDPNYYNSFMAINNVIKE